MNEFPQINNIIAQSIRDSSYISVLLSSSIFIIYTVIVKVIDYYKSKNRNKPILEMAIALQESAANIQKLNNVLDKSFKDADRKENNRRKVAIELSFLSFKSRIASECNNIIIRNNIQANELLIKDNIHKIISTEYYKLFAILSDYEVNGINVATRLKEEWIKDVYDNVINIVFNNQDKINRVAQLDTRLLLFIADYTTYITNKTNY